MSILRGLGRHNHEERAGLSYQDVWGQALDTAGGFQSTAGNVVNEHRALQSLTVYGCVSLLADALASLTLRAYRQTGTVKKEIPPPTILTDPYSKEMGSYDWMHRVMVSLTLRGNAFCWLTRSPIGDVVEMIPIHPDYVTITRPDFVTNDLRFFVQGKEVPRENMMHIPAFTIPSFPLGLNPIEYMRNQIGGELATQEFGNRWFADSAIPSGILTSDQSLSNDDAQLLQDRWSASQGGRRRKTAVLGMGLKWTQISVSPDDSQFLETLKFKSHDIAGKLYRIPPHMIGDVERSTSWGTGIEQQMIGFINFTLAPWATRIERALSSLLPRGQYVKFDFDSLLRGDMAARAAYYAQAIEHSWMMADEVRAREDLEPLPDDQGKNIYYPINYAILGETTPVDTTPTNQPGAQPSVPTNTQLALPMNGSSPNGTKVKVTSNG